MPRLLGKKIVPSARVSLALGLALLLVSTLAVLMLQRTDGSTSAASLATVVIATATASLDETPPPGPTCADRNHGHLDLETFQTNVGEAEAIVSEVDNGAVSVEIGGERFVIQGWNEGIIVFPSSNDEVLLERVMAAVEASRYAC